MKPWEQLFCSACQVMTSGVDLHFYDAAFVLLLCYEPASCFAHQRIFLMCSSVIHYLCRTLCAAGKVSDSWRLISNSHARCNKKLIHKVQPCLMLISWGRWKTKSVFFLQSAKKSFNSESWRPKKSNRLTKTGWRKSKTLKRNTKLHEVQTRKKRSKHWQKCKIHMRQTQWYQEQNWQPDNQWRNTHTQGLIH